MRLLPALALLAASLSLLACTVTSPTPAAVVTPAGGAMVVTPGPGGATVVTPASGGAVIIR